MNLEFRKNITIFHGCPSITISPDADTINLCMVLRSTQSLLQISSLQETMFVPDFRRLLTSDPLQRMDLKQCCQRAKISAAKPQKVASLKFLRPE
jgi:hypothetical protein